MSIRNLVTQINAGQTTARALVEDALKKAKDAEEYHALLSLTEERALARADEIDARIKAGEQVGASPGYGSRETRASWCDLYR